MEKQQEFISKWSLIIDNRITQLQRQKEEILEKCKFINGPEVDKEMVKFKILDAEIHAYTDAVASALKIDREIRRTENKSHMKYSLETLIAEVNLGDFVCTSFEDAQNNDRRKNIVIIDDSDIYLTYKTKDGCFGDFACWVSDEFEEDENVFLYAIEWAKDIYYRTEEDIDKALEAGYFPLDFKPYEELEMEF